MASALTQALQDFKNWTGKAVGSIGSFVQQNPTPAAYIQKQASPIVQNFTQSVNQAWNNPPKLPTYKPMQAVDSFVNWTNSVIPGGWQGGVNRVQQSFKNPQQYNIFAQPEVTGYVKNLGQSAVDTAKSAYKLTPAYDVQRRLQGNPQSLPEYGGNALNTGLSALNTVYRATPLAPAYGALLGTIGEERRQIQGNIQNGTPVDYMKIIQKGRSGIVDQPGVGQVFTDDPKAQQAIDIVAMAAFIAAPYLSKKLNQLNLKADEINKVSDTLGVKSNAGMDEINSVWKKKMVEMRDVLAGRGTPEQNAQVVRLNQAHDLLEKTGVVERNYAAAYTYVKNIQPGFTTKPITQAEHDALYVTPKRLTVGRSINVQDGLRETLSTSTTPDQAIQKLNSYVTEYSKGADTRQLADLRAGLVKEVTNLTGGSGNYKKDYAMRVALRNDTQVGGLVRTLEDQIASIDVTLSKTPKTTTQRIAERLTPSTPVNLDPSWINESPTLTTKGGLGREMARHGYVANEIEGLTPQEGHRMLVENIPAYKNDMMAKAELWKDKPRLSYARETMERNFADIMGKDAPTMVNAYIEPIFKSEAARVKWLNQERKDIAALGIKPRSEDSKFVQMLGEHKISPKEVSLLPQARAEKIFTAEKVLRQKYDSYLEKLNMVLKRNGYDPVPKREDYFRHFTEIRGVLETVGIPMRENSLPTDINGLTADFRPGRQFFANTLQRKTDVTDYDAIQGIDGYIEGASKQMFQTDNIKRLRRLDKSIRETFAGTRHLTNFVADLTEYTNILAGKKAMIDRSVETALGRGFYSATDRLRRQAGANMVGFNVASAVTNYIPFTQSLAVTDKPSFMKGMLQTIAATFKDDGFVDRSQFLTSRHGSDKLSMNAWEKIGDKSFWLFKVIDNFTSGTIVRSKYAEGIKKGLLPVEAMKQADSWARKIMAGRTAGEMPTMFNSKTLALVTQFQLEVNNQMSFMFKDIPRNFNWFGTASALAQVFLYGYIFNNVYEKVFGRRPAFDPIWVVLQTYQDYTNPDMKKGQATKNAVENVSNQLPFTSVLTGGRIPIGSAIPDPLAIARGDSTLSKEAKKLFYLLPPTGGGQLRKTLEGTRAYQQGASTTDAGAVRYPIPQTPVNAIRTAIGGQYVTPEARQYFREGRTPLSEKQSQLFFQSPDKVETYQQIMQDREDNAQVAQTKAQVKQTGKPLIQGSQVYYPNATGGVTMVDISYTPPQPQPTGNAAIDKKNLTAYKAALTSQKNKLIDLAQSGLVDMSQVSNQINTLSTTRNALGSASSSSGRTVAVKKISIPSMKAPTIKALKLKTTGFLKIKSTKVPIFAKLKFKQTAMKPKMYKIRNVKLNLPKSALAQALGSSFKRIA